MEIISSYNKHNEAFKDISSFENYSPYWDQKIFDIINNKHVDCFSIQSDKNFNQFENEWEMFLDTLAYFKYVDFCYPNLSVGNSSNYIKRSVLITKDQFEEIIKNRKNKKCEKTSYETIRKTLTCNFKFRIKQLLHLVNFNGRLFTEEQENLIYTTIAQQLTYGNSCTHLTLDDIESYCSKYNFPPLNSFCCKIYEINDLNDFDSNHAHSMLVFAKCKNNDTFNNILSNILNDDEMSIELFSFNVDPNIQTNYQIIIIYPWQLTKEEFDKREQFLLKCINNSKAKKIIISRYNSTPDFSLFEIIDEKPYEIKNNFHIDDLYRVALLSNKLNIGPQKFNIKNKKRLDYVLTKN